MREREERLKGWSVFLGDEKSQVTQKAEAERAEAGGQGQEAENQQEETDGREEKEEVTVESTDSSLAGSDDES